MTIGIAVFNQKGGAGKTTVTVNLAAALASQGVSVLVCDLDGQASLSAAVGLDEAVYTGPDESKYTLLITKKGDQNRMILKAPMMTLICYRAIRGRTWRISSYCPYGTANCG